jgi:hypothetical protein
VPLQHSGSGGAPLNVCLSIPKDQRLQALRALTIRVLEPLWPPEADGFEMEG